MNLYDDGGGDADADDDDVFSVDRGLWQWQQSELLLELVFCMREF